MTNSEGRLYGIGVGPGDPELITLKAFRILRSVPVVAYQSAVDKESIARKIVS
ncbi:MAG: SAM-dependent methyltransferase, partial [Dolichospermum sp.]